jgi:predicted RNA binding protein YcfA (HicA-like mRNA interferase family)
MQQLVESFGFQLQRVSGSHHIYARPGLTEQLNLQTVNGKAKPYQVRQFLKIIERYNLQLQENA